MPNDTSATQTFTLVSDGKNHQVFEGKKIVPLAVNEVLRVILEVGNAGYIVSLGVKDSTRPTIQTFKTGRVTVKGTQFGIGTRVNTVRTTDAAMRKLLEAAGAYRSTR